MNLKLQENGSMLCSLMSFQEIFVFLAALDFLSNDAILAQLVFALSIQTVDML